MRRLIGLGVVSFCGALGAVVGLRLSEGVLAVLAGVVLGGGLVVAMGGVVAWVLVRERRAERDELVPPRVVATWRQGAAQAMMPAVERQFYVIGESGEVIELTPNHDEETQALLG